MTTQNTSATTPRRLGSNPSTPTIPRTITQQQSPSMAGGFEGSPTATLSPGSRTTSSQSQGDGVQAPYRGLFATIGTASTKAEAQRHLYVPANPALLTCFDPTDKELYDLWAPKR